MMPRVSLLRAFQRFYSAPRLHSAVRIRICRPMYPHVSASLCSPHALRPCYATSFSSQVVATYPLSGPFRTTTPAKDQEILANRSFNKVLSTFIARDKALRSRIHAKPQVYVGDQANQRSWNTHLKEEGRIFGIA